MIDYNLAKITFTTTWDDKIEFNPANLNSAERNNDAQHQV